MSSSGIGLCMIHMFNMHFHIINSEMKKQVPTHFHMKYKTQCRNPFLKNGFSSNVTYMKQIEPKVLIPTKEGNNYGNTKR